MQDPALKSQSKGRPLTEAETALAAALETIYAECTHDFAAVADALNRLSTARPSGQSGPWTLDVLEQELTAINASHDAAYAADGIGT